MRKHYAHQSTNARKLGPTSKQTRLRRMDLRTVEARYIKAYSSQLRAEIPPQALSPISETLIDRCARMALLVHLFETRDGGFAALAEIDQNKYLSYSNALGKLLQRLALIAAPHRPPGRPSRKDDFSGIARLLATPQQTKGA